MDFIHRTARRAAARLQHIAASQLAYRPQFVENAAIAFGVAGIAILMLARAAGVLP